MLLIKRKRMHKKDLIKFELTLVGMSWGIKLKDPKNMENRIFMASLHYHLIYQKLKTIALVR